MLVNGLVTLRSYRRFDFFRLGFMDSIEKSANSTFCFISANRWIGIRLDSLCVGFGTSVALFSVLMKNDFDRELLTFSLQIVIDVSVMFSMAVRYFSDI